MSGREVNARAVVALAEGKARYDEDTRRWYIKASDVGEPGEREFVLDIPSLIDAFIDADRHQMPAVDWRRWQ